ncbi:hypothetical protein HWI79_3246 [Cryptosporidium felis]|nr:hypothetical protein HWI79_3246 [Cryptosporidium felis]
MQSENEMGKDSFPKDLVRLAMQEQEMKDKIWTLITGGDKNKTISRKEIAEISEIFGLNLCQSEIDSVLFWGKYGSDRRFKKIEKEWLEVQVGLPDSKVGSSQENLVDKRALEEIELSYADFCNIFERNERNCKRRVARKIDVSKLK